MPAMDLSPEILCHHWQVKIFYARTISPSANASLTSFLQNLTANFAPFTNLVVTLVLHFPMWEKEVCRTQREALHTLPESLKTSWNHGPMRFRKPLVRGHS